MLSAIIALIEKLPKNIRAIVFSVLSKFASGLARK